MVNYFDTIFCKFDLVYTLLCKQKSFEKINCLPSQWQNVRFIYSHKQKFLILIKQRLQIISNTTPTDQSN